MRRHACLATGLVATLALTRGEPSAWLLKLEAVGFMLMALLFGFTAWMPSPPGWLRHREVRGLVCFLVGVGAMFVDPRLVIAAVFIGVGSRMMLGTDDREPSRDIVIRTQSRDVTR